MKPNFAVLTDSSPAGERACAYAAAPLGAKLHLIYVLYPPARHHRRVCLHPAHAQCGLPAYASVRAYGRGGRASPAATAEATENDWDTAVQQTLAAYRPLLLLAGSTATHGRLEKWLNNRALPLAHLTGYPLLLVPEHLPAAWCP